MPKLPVPSENGVKLALTQYVIHDLPSIFLSLALFLGGVWLLSLRIPGWSLFFGLIVTPLGIVFTIYTLDDVAKNVIAPPEFKPIKCKVCGKTTYAKKEDKDFICGQCREDIAEAILKETK